MINGRYYAQATLKPATSGRVSTFFHVSSIRRHFFDTTDLLVTYMLARTFPLALRSRQGRVEGQGRSLRNSLGRTKGDWRSGRQQLRLGLEHSARLELVLALECELEFGLFEPEAELVAFAA